MVKNGDDKAKANDDTSKDSGTPKSVSRNRGKKRKRLASRSSSDSEDVLPENTLEVEKSLHASAIKNNLDPISMRKIIKKVVTNDHVLALVKLREEEEDSSTEELQPKLTRAKATKLNKIKWDLSPIKHIPVKTRPEVKALIAVELPEDEDDEEYEPTHEDVPSDEDLGVESSSDVDSQPRTPVTPRNTEPSSPMVVQDGPFKVPREVSSTRRKLNLEEEEATIALRTRSKHSLSATSIEHIESTFVPPDELPMPVGDDLWNQFLTDCLDPGHTSRHEDDDEADPEYNVAADPDADEEDDPFGNSILKISRKELSDLMTELFNIMPDATEDADLAEDLANSVLTEGGQPVPEQVTTQWDGKKEPTSDDETSVRIADRITFERKSTGPAEVENNGEPSRSDKDVQSSRSDKDVPPSRSDKDVPQTHNSTSTTKENEKAKVAAEKPNTSASRCVKLTVEEDSEHSLKQEIGKRLPPLPLRKKIASRPKKHKVQIQLDSEPCILGEQVLILQQQLRQHIQLAASNFMQLFANVVHWAEAHTYKEYLESLVKLVEANPKSVVDVCNLKPALELVCSWEKATAEDTPENAEMVAFVQAQLDRYRRRSAHNSLYVGEFHERFLRVVSNSSVFLYPYLLPAMPYRPDNTQKRFSYLHSEDELIALGLDEFWQYVENNPLLFRPRARAGPRQRWGLGAAAQLVVKHMMPWLSLKSLLQHVAHVKKVADKDNPIVKFFDRREVTPVQHRLLPFNPAMTLYEQPEHEVPRSWLRYLSKTSGRFKSYLKRRSNVTGVPPAGVDVDPGEASRAPKKNPLPIRFTRKILTHRTNVLPVVPKPILHDKFDLLIEKNTTNAGLASNTTLVSPSLKEPAIVAPNTIILSPIVQGPKNPENTVIVPAIVQPRMTEEVITLTPAVQTSGLPGQKTNASQINQIATPTQAVNVIPQESLPLEIQKLITANTVPKNNGTSTNTASVIPPDKVATPPPQNPAPTNFYQVVETSTGAFLVPMTVNTVNCITAPIASSVEKTTLMANDLPESAKSRTAHTSNYPDEYMGIKETKEHCRCCVLLRRITKLRQTVITDYFSSRRDRNRCPCSGHKYPKISRKMRLLLSYYRSKSFSVVQSLDAKLEPAKHEVDKMEGGDWTLDELAYVTTYQLKLTMRSNVARNNLIKIKVNKLISSFRPDRDDPTLLARRLEKAFDVEMVDVYKEFLAFLTPEQADRMDAFRDYFIRNCVEDLMKKVEEQVPEKCKQLEILNKLNKLLLNNFAQSCDICFGLLSTMISHPKLAEYVFSLFPHRVESRCVEQAGGSVTSAAEHAKSMETMFTQDGRSGTRMTMDYEADHSSSGEDSNESFTKDPLSLETCRGEDDPAIKQELSSGELMKTGHAVEFPVTKTEQEDSDSSESMMIMSDEEQIKTEPPDWKREEDKLILEVLQQHLTLIEMKDKTILENIEWKDLLGMLSENLTQKSIGDIKDRVLYLLKIL